MPRVSAMIAARATVVAAVVAVVGAIMGSSRGVVDAGEAAVAPLFLVGILAPTLVGLFVALRRPNNRVAWILLLGALSVAVVLAASNIAALALHDDRESSLGLWAATVASPWPVLFIWPLALAFVFPNGTLPSPRWRPVARAAFAICALIVVLLIGFETHESAYGPVKSPLPVTIGEWAVPIFWACWFGLLASLFASAAAVRARYRAGDELLRRQVLWLAYGALLIPLWLGGTSLLAEFGVHTEFADGVTLTLLQAWPAVAVAIAVTRYGLYSIDRLLPRTLVYAALTLALVATYALVSLLAGLAIGTSELSASVATLAVALVFLPLRARLQTLVDRRFASRRFEAVRLLRDFLDEVRHGRAEPEDVGAVIAVALADPGATVAFQLPICTSLRASPQRPRSRFWG